MLLIVNSYTLKQAHNLPLNKDQALYQSTLDYLNRIFKIVITTIKVLKEVGGIKFLILIKAQLSKMILVEYR